MAGESNVAACRLCLPKRVADSADSLSELLSITVNFPPGFRFSSATYNVDESPYRSAVATAEKVNTNETVVRRLNTTNILFSLHIQTHPTDRTRDFTNTGKGKNILILTVDNI